MKQIGRTRHLGWTLGLIVAGGLTALATVHAGEEGPRPEQLRDEARQLEHKAADLKAGGRLYEAKKLMDEAETLVAKADRMGKQGEDSRRPELKAEIKELQAHIKKMRAEGNEDAAAKAKQRLQELEKQASEPREPAPVKRPPEAERRVGPERGQRPGPGPQDLPEPERRRHHLQVAIENLHAAGLHEPAERLARQADQMARRPGGPGEGMRPGLGPRGAGVQELRAEIQELRQALAELRRRVEELHRDRR
jgi:hypothetical protein